MDDGLNDVNGNREQGRTRGAYTYKTRSRGDELFEITSRIEWGFRGKRKNIKKRDKNAHTRARIYIHKWLTRVRGVNPLCACVLCTYVFGGWNVQCEYLSIYLYNIIKYMRTRARGQVDL